MSNRYHNEFHPSCDNHYGSQFSFHSSYEEGVENKIEGSVYGSMFDLDYQYEGHFVPPNDVGLYPDPKNHLEDNKICACTIL